MLEQMPMPEFTTSVFIAQPPEVVAAAFERPENAVHWMSNLERFDVVRGRLGEKDALVHLHYREGDRVYVMEDRMVEWERGRLYHSEVSGNGLVADVKNTLSEEAGGTRLAMTWNGRGKNLLMKFLLAFMSKKIARSAHEELQRFRDLVQERGADFSTPKP
jgi:hypothetical protein